MKRILCTAAALILSTAAFIPVQAIAQTGYSIVIHNAPPPPRREAIPAPRRGYEWIPGYWNAKGKRHSWTPGHWERVRRGQHYERPQWQQVDGGWRLNRGGWHQGENGPRGDRDHDGVQNRDDNRPNNPRRN